MAGLVQQRTIGFVLQQVGEDGFRVIKVFNGLEQRADANLAKPVVVIAAGESAQPGQVHDFENMAGGMRHRDDVIAKGVVADFRSHGAHDIEYFQRFPGVVRQTGTIQGRGCGCQRLRELLLPGGFIQ